MHPALCHRLHRVWIWTLRVLVSWLMLTGLVPARLHLEFLRWLREDMDPLHPKLPEVLRELAEQEARCA